MLFSDTFDTVMKLNLLNPKQSLSLAYRRLRPVRSKLNLFKASLLELLHKIEASEGETEEHAKNYIRDFLLTCYYKGTNEINTLDRKDLVIHIGKSIEDKVGVIIETKKPGSKSEIPTKEKPNCKALQELVLYYLRERLDKENIDLKYLIITDAYKWYIFEAAWFEKHFYRNAAFRKQYEEWRDEMKVTADTGLFYKSIAKPFIDKIEEDVNCTYFDIRNYERALTAGGEDDKGLLALYKILSPGHLLKIGFEDDSNKLDEKFYKELLHIIGLEEVKDGSKFVIRRKKENANKGSLLENAISLLETEGYDKVPDINQYGSTKEERLFNIALELCITWINRILFLKLLEGQLVNYHNGDKDYLFLNSKMIPDYGELFKLFHKVLAIDIPKRDAGLQKKYSRVPYLNSSLFEISELEDVTIKINSLDSSLELEFIGATILKEEKKKDDSLPALEYLFKFLNAYDFASESTEDIDEENKTLINASVLGKVFEKINGYKDGSIFTPGFITMYMCRQSIRQAVLQKFKDKYEWKADEFDDLKNYIIDRRSKKDILLFNELVNSLHICDPAVGSGHFLVSALNEIIAIKSELGILADKDGVRIQEYNVVIENDELFVTNQFGDVYSYLLHNGKPENKESQRLQMTLFHEKQTIIENCLFGVDINPNSVKICRLRLWIELLKNAYYKEEDDYSNLETLPNIDINIKCGNSLLSRFSLDQNLTAAFKKQKFNLLTYKTIISAYRSSRDRTQKKELLSLIEKIKSEYTATIYRSDPRRARLSEIRGQLELLKNNYDLFGKKIDEDDKELEEIRLTKLLAQRERELEDAESGKLYKNALEWRFEFPEVLNDNGDFMGFDIVIGNPPYFSLSTLSTELQTLFQNSNYKTFSKTSDIYCLFYEKGNDILKSGGTLNFITSNKWLNAAYGKKIRGYLLKETNPTLLIDFSKVVVFPDAVVFVNILSFNKGKNKNQLLGVKIKDDFQIHTSNLEKYVNEKRVTLNDLNDESWSVEEKTVQEITKRIEKIGTPLSKWNIFINAGIKTAMNPAFHIDELTRKELISEDSKSAEIIKPLLRGKDIKRWGYEYKNIYIINSHNGIKEKNIPRINVKKDYPAIYKHLLQYYDKDSPKAIKLGDGKYQTLKDREDQGDDWTNLRNCAFLEEFEKEKIVWIEISDKANYCLDQKGMYLTNSAYFITGQNLKYLLALLNSKLMDFYFFQKTAQIAGGRKRYTKQYVELLPIPKVSNKKSIQRFDSIVDKVITQKEQAKDTSELEAEIDAMVYELYGLTEEEIKIVEDGK